MVKNLGVKLGLDIGAAICDRSIGSSQLLISNTLGNTAKSKGLLDIRKYLCLAANGDFLSFYKSGEAKVFQVIKAKLRCDLRQCFYSDDIHGLCYCCTQRVQTSVFTAPPVVDGTSVCIVERSIIHNRSKGKACAVKGRSVNRYDLEGGAGLTFGISSTV